MVMRMYIIFVILLQNHEKAVRTILGSFGRDCYFSFMTLRLGFLKVIFSGWVSMTPSLIFIVEE